MDLSPCVSPSIYSSVPDNSTASTESTEGAFGFEGPEKNLEIWCITGEGAEGGFRAISFDRWKEILREVKCEVLQLTHNELDFLK